MTDIEREKIVALAKRLEDARQRVTALGATNTYGMTPEDQIRISALHRLASDALRKASAEYEVAISGLSNEEMMELIG